MVSPRSEARSGVDATAKAHADHPRDPSSYQQCRDQRIKENKERLQTLGILAIASELSKNKKKQTPVKKERNKSVVAAGSPRRSSRLKDKMPVSYKEVPIRKKSERLDLEVVEINIPEGSLPEVYTEEAEKLLGDHQKAWTLYVDGYDEDGERIYDPINGKTCHQCRQKTLGKHTQCSKCRTVQGQFCGDCLFTRYGENVEEVNENQNWICPVCRGICNCSRCRRLKGWMPTGNLYKKVIQLGFRSVAHYLIQTQRPQIHEDTVVDESPKVIDQDGCDGSYYEVVSEDDKVLLDPIIRFTR